MRVLTHTVEPRDEGRRLGRVIASRLFISVHLLRTLKAQDGILLDGEAAHTDRIVRAGQVITLVLERGGTERTGDPGALRVPYIDADLLIVDKEAPLPTLPSRHQSGETLREQTMRYLGEAEPYTFRPVNRLDKGTSGLMAVARNAHAQQQMARMLHTDAFVREYLAVVQGIPAQPQGVIDAPIARVPGETVRRCVEEGGQAARTQFCVLQTGDARALVRLRLFTGRTHQIRVHLAHIGCPIVGDYLYGREEASLPGRFALHSAYLSLRQPVTGEKIEIKSALPQALRCLLDAR